MIFVRVLPVKTICFTHDVQLANPGDSYFYSRLDFQGRGLYYPVMCGFKKNVYKDPGSLLNDQYNGM